MASLHRRQLLHLAVLLTLTILATTVSRAQAAAVSDVVVFNSASFGNPTFIPTRGRTGLLYGVTGGTVSDPGNVFNFSPSGTTHTLYTASPSSGNGLLSSLTLGTDGNFYGTTQNEAVIGNGTYGNLFRVTPKGAFTVLHYFNGGSDGAYPFGAPIEASDGNLYGVTFGGCCYYSTVYKYTPAGVFSVISTLSGAQCLNAQDIIQGSDGHLYITCSLGGATNNGSIVKLATTGKLLNYYLFPGGPGGAEPVGLVLASDGNYYGATLFGGIPGNGDGTLFRMTPEMKVTILYAFDPRHGSHDGTLPGYLIQATDGYLYSYTFSGGLYGYGTIFRISIQGEYSQIYSFPLSVGNEPQFIMQDTSGMLYGSANLGSTGNYGSIFSLDMGLGPFVTFVSPTGKAGQSAEILGQGFTGISSVTFNGLEATSFSVKSDTYMTAVIPTGATAGPVVVTTPTGKLTSNVNFRVSK